VNRALVARFCVLGSGLLRGHNPTIARFRAEVSGPELRKFGLRVEPFWIVERLVWVSPPERGDLIRPHRARRLAECPHRRQARTVRDSADPAVRHVDLVDRHR